jgi:Cu/Zn superoxide dismutase
MLPNYSYFHSLLYFILIVILSISGESPPRCSELSDVSLAHSFLSFASSSLSVQFLQCSSLHPVYITVKSSGLASGTYGLTVHQYGDLSSSINLLGVDYNPDNLLHGCSNNTIRHTGDLGNITIDSSSTQAFTFSIDLIDLHDTKYSIIGRSLALHAHPNPCDPQYKSLDDIIAVGIIGISNPINSVVTNNAANQLMSRSIFTNPYTGIINPPYNAITILSNVISSNNSSNSSALNIYSSQILFTATGANYNSMRLIASVSGLAAYARYALIFLHYNIASTQFIINDITYYNNNETLARVGEFVSDADGYIGADVHVPNSFLQYDNKLSILGRAIALTQSGGNSNNNNNSSKLLAVGSIGITSQQPDLPISSFNCNYNGPIPQGSYYIAVNLVKQYYPLPKNLGNIFNQDIAAAFGINTQYFRCFSLSTLFKRAQSKRKLTLLLLNINPPLTPLLLQQFKFQLSDSLSRLRVSSVGSFISGEDGIQSLLSNCVASNTADFKVFTAICLNQPAGITYQYPDYLSAILVSFFIVILGFGFLYLRARGYLNERACRDCWKKKQFKPVKPKPNWRIRASQFIHRDQTNFALAREQIALELQSANRQ